jgi:hypothetical protein
MHFQAMLPEILDEGSPMSCNLNTRLSKAERSSATTAETSIS